MGVTRRDLLVGGLSVGAATSLAGCLGGRVGSSLGGLVETPDPNAMEQDLGDGFEKLIWQPDGSAKVSFEETHGMDGFYIAHESDRAKRALASCHAPRYGGSITIPLLSLLQTSEFEYPSRRFKFIGGEGAFARCSSRAEVYWIDVFGTMGATYFTVPERFSLSTTG